MEKRRCAEERGRGVAAEERGGGGANVRVKTVSSRGSAPHGTPTKVAAACRRIAVGCVSVGHGMHHVTLMWTEGGLELTFLDKGVEILALREDAGVGHDACIRHHIVDLGPQGREGARET